MELDSPGASAPSSPKTSNAVAKETVDKADTKPDEVSLAPASISASAAAGAASSGGEHPISEPEPVPSGTEGPTQAELVPADVPMAEVEEATVSEEPSLPAPTVEPEQVSGISEVEKSAVEIFSVPDGSTAPLADASPSPQARAPEASHSADPHESKEESPIPGMTGADIASSSAQDTTEIEAKTEAPASAPNFTMPSPSALRAFLPDAVSRLLPLIGTPGTESQSQVAGDSNVPPEHYLPVPSPPPSEPTPPPRFAESPAPSNGSATAASYPHFQQSSSQPQSARSPAPSNASNSTSQLIPRPSRSRSPVMSSRPPTMSDANVCIRVIFSSCNRHVYCLYLLGNTRRW